MVIVIIVDVKTMTQPECNLYINGSGELPILTKNMLMVRAAHVMFYNRDILEQEMYDVIAAGNCGIITRD